MKKILLLLLVFFIIVGCDNTKVSNSMLNEGEKISSNLDHIELNRPSDEQTYNLNNSLAAQSFKLGAEPVLIPKRVKEDFLVYGYTRQNFEGFIPIDILKLLYDFCSLDLKMFLLYKNKISIYNSCGRGVRENNLNLKLKSELKFNLKYCSKYSYLIPEKNLIVLICNPQEICLVNYSTKNTKTIRLESDSNGEFNYLAPYVTIENQNSFYFLFENENCNKKVFNIETGEEAIDLSFFFNQKELIINLYMNSLTHFRLNLQRALYINFRFSSPRQLLELDINDALCKNVRMYYTKNYKVIADETTIKIISKEKNEHTKVYDNKEITSYYEPNSCSFMALQIYNYHKNILILPQLKFGNFFLCKLDLNFSENPFQKYNLHYNNILQYGIHYYMGTSIVTSMDEQGDLKCWTIDRNDNIKILSRIQLDPKNLPYKILFS